MWKGWGGVWVCRPKPHNPEPPLKCAFILHLSSSPFASHQATSRILAKCEKRSDDVRPPELYFLRTAGNACAQPLSFLALDHKSTPTQTLWTAAEETTSTIQLGQAKIHTSTIQKPPGHFASATGDQQKSCRTIHIPQHAFSLISGTCSEILSTIH